MWLFSFYSIQLLLLDVRDQHCTFVITIVTGECTIMITKQLWFGVCHRCYYLLIYYDSFIVLCFILNLPMVQWWNRYKDWSFCLSKISNMFICIIFEHKCLAADKEVHNLQFLITRNKYSNQVYVIKPSDHWKMRLYQGSAKCCEGDPHSDFNRLASAILVNTLL